MGRAPRYTVQEKKNLPIAKRRTLLKAVITHKIVDSLADRKNITRGHHVRNEMKEVESPSPSVLGCTKVTNERKSARARRNKPRLSNGGVGEPRKVMKIEANHGFLFKQKNHYDLFSNLVKQDWLSQGNLGSPDAACYTRVFHGAFLDHFYTAYNLTRADVPPPPRRLQ